MNMSETKKVKIEVENLYKVFGKNPGKALSMVKEGASKDDVLAKTRNTVGLNDNSFKVYEGETLVIMGLSGSGKSTLLRCLNRLIEPTAGTVKIDGVDVTALSDDELIRFRREKFGMVFQNFALFPHRTIAENAAYGLEIQGVDKTTRLAKAHEVLEVVGLKGYENAKPKELSGGMQQRVGLARALAVDPDILLMDEAFSALDPLIRSDMQDELIALEDAVKKTIVFITHDLDEALKMGDRIILMKDGKIIQVGTSDEILTNPANTYVERFVENVDVTKILTARDVMAKPRGVTYLKDGPHTALHKMKEMGTSGIFVVTKTKELYGFISAKKASEAIEAGDNNLEDIIEKYDKQIVAPDTPVRGLFQAVVDSRYPLAVVDESQKFLGYIVEGSILAGLAEGGSSRGEL